MIWLYRILFLPLLLLTLPRFLRRMWRRGGYGRDFGHRFGASPRIPRGPGVRRIWIQAVSVGELLAVEPVLVRLGSDPSVEVYLTTTTSTGYALAQERYRHRVAGVGYFPLDFWWCSRRAWNRIGPDCVVLMEGELWPEHLHRARTRRVPALLINARMSDRSYRRYRWVPSLARRVLRNLTRIMASSPQDQQRFRELAGAGPVIETAGNLKVDRELDPLLSAEAIAGLRNELGFGGDGADRPVVLLGSSTWPGEEEILIDVFRRLRREGRPVRLLLVPRHAERRSEIRILLQRQGGDFRWALRTEMGASGGATEPVDIHVADTTGELVRLTQAADIVFVGKSLPPHTEGQTPVEAAAIGKPILLGPGMSNFRAIVEQLEASGAARRVAHAEEIHEAVISLLDHPALATQAAASGSAWHAAHRGAVDRVVAAIREAMQPGGA